MKKGFTLIEILIYIAVLSVIVLAVSAFLSWAIKSNNKTRAMREVLDNGRRAMETMTYEIKEAKGLYAPTSAASQLSLETSHYLPTGESFSYIDFYLCGTDLSTICQKKELEDPIPLTSDRVEVNNLAFGQIATTSVQIGLGINFKNPQNRPEYEAVINVTSTASLRSY